MWTASAHRAPQSARSGRVSGAKPSPERSRDLYEYRTKRLYHAKTPIFGPLYTAGSSFSADFWTSNTAHLSFRGTFRTSNTMARWFLVGDTPARGDGAMYTVRCVPHVTCARTVQIWVLHRLQDSSARSFRDTYFGPLIPSALVLATYYGPQIRAG